MFFDNQSVVAPRFVDDNLFHDSVYSATR
jgi:hypothetical protein